MINCKKSNIYVVKYEHDSKVKTQHFVANSLLDVTNNFKTLFGETKLMSVALAADVLVLNTYDVNISEPIS